MVIFASVFSLGFFKQIQVSFELGGAFRLLLAS